MDKQQIFELLEKYYLRQTTEEELSLIRHLLLTKDQKEIVVTALNELLLREGRSGDIGDAAEWQLIKRAIVSVDKVVPPPLQEQAPVMELFSARKSRLVWMKYAAAIVLILGIGVYLYLFSKKDMQADTPESMLVQKDILPGGEKALLTLADGTSIALDSVGTGTLAQQGGSQVIKLADGQVAYNQKGTGKEELLMNTISTPKGGQYQLILPDGSRVWLNAASSITFPVRFAGIERKVSIKGEVYFEVKGNKSMPFLVDVDDRSIIEVLGTGFNINAYKDESKIRTTLIDGSVRVGRSVILKPGQQAVVSVSEVESKSPAVQVQPADIDQTIAWKNGVFNWENAGMKEVVSQLQRWYDIDVIYEGAIPDIRFHGEVFRTVPLSSVIRYFGKIGIAARLQGRELIISGK